MGNLMDNETKRVPCEGNRRVNNNNQAIFLSSRKKYLQLNATSKTAF